GGKLPPPPVPGPPPPPAPGRKGRVLPPAVPALPQGGALSGDTGTAPGEERRLRCLSHAEGREREHRPYGRDGPPHPAPSGPVEARGQESARGRDADPDPAGSPAIRPRRGRARS